MMQNIYPKWWTEENDSKWDRIKSAVKRRWRGDAAGQAAGEPSIPRQQTQNEEFEPAFRFGFGARLQYCNQFWEWNADLEKRLKQEWNEMYPSRADVWNEDCQAIRHGWDYITDISPESQEDREDKMRRAA